MTENCARVTITTLLIWRLGCKNSSVVLCGKAGEDFEKGVFVDIAFFEPFFLADFSSMMPKSKLIRLYNRN
jgi:hypothetical protein